MYINYKHMHAQNTITTVSLLVSVKCTLIKYILHADCYNNNDTTIKIGMF